MAEIIFNVKKINSLPYTFEYTPESDAEVTLMLQGTAWAAANGFIGIQLEIDGTPICTSEIFSNETREHRALAPGLAKHAFNISLVDNVIQPVSITVSVLNTSTRFDINDYVSLVIL